MARRFIVLAAGKALPHLRQKARAKGQWLLQDLFPHSNSASLLIPDWDYNAEVRSAQTHVRATVHTHSTLMTHTRQGVQVGGEKRTRTGNCAHVFHYGIL